MTPASRHLRTAIALAAQSTRRALGWSREDLARRSGVSKTTLAELEAGTANFTIDLAGRVLSALRVTVDLRITAPHAESRQRDLAHARCVAYVQRRLETWGWIVRREVEILGTRSHGWIDLLAFDPLTGTLLVVEVKTEIRDLGRVERAIGWYEREAIDVARRLGWDATRATAWLLCLATEAVDRRILDNKLAVSQSFPAGPVEMLALARRVEGAPANRGIALVDPRSRRREWLIRARAGGRRSPAPYRDYADFTQRLAAASGADL